MLVVGLQSPPLTREAVNMTSSAVYKIHPIVMGTKIFDKTMMTYQFGAGRSFTIPIYSTLLHNDHRENDFKCGRAVFFVHAKELERIHDPHPLDYRYLEDYIEDVEANEQIEIVREDKEILPGIRVSHTPAHTEGGLTVFVDTAKGVAAITGYCAIDENLHPSKTVRSMEMDVIPPGTHVNVYEAYDILREVKVHADVLIPLHEPRFAAMDTIP